MGLTRFHPAVQSWFAQRFGRPTEIQDLAWGPIADGEHLLVVAPTGSGKTLTGFLWPLERLLTGAWEAGGVRVVYVSPLKALNADIERNLEEPLVGLSAALEAAGVAPCAVRVAVRSGDTPPAERQRMLRRPPEMLITTPESLNLLLLSKSAGRLFRGVKLVILDEIHAVAATKRGTHLITAVERLARIAGEFQRLAISATVRPLDRVAAFVGGYRLERGAGGEPRHVRRPVRVVASRAEKRYDLAVRWVGKTEEDDAGAESLWLRLAEELRARIAEARSTLVFTNSRRGAEKLTRLVNDAAGREVAWSHHGSLARELRAAVERRLKEGSLPAIVATSSLELGIDIGFLDRVLLVQAPRSLASSAQRIGRAGHGVGETSHAIFYPTHPRDFLDCAVAVRAVLEGEIEPISPIRNPLDLLAQVVLSAVASEAWGIDDLYAFARCAEPFHDLPRRHFDLVIEMLAGRYAETRVPELRPRIAFDRLTGTVEGRPGGVQLLARSGGTIPDRGYFQLRTEETRSRLGELDEEFVWERHVGDTFVLGTQAWRIRAIHADEVLVTPARGGASLAPFWRADARDRGSFASERVANLLARANTRLDDPAFAEELVAAHRLEPDAAAELVALLAETRAVLGGELPHRGHLVCEESVERGGDEARRQVVLYTFWGGTVNRPLALALAGAWEEREGSPLETMADDDAVLLFLPEGSDPRALLAAVTPERCEELLRRRLESSGYFGAHFRQNAQRALLLPRAGPSRRTPLWMSRQNAKKLLAAVERFEDFPVVLETWRTCLQDEFELETLRRRLTEVAAGDVRVSYVKTDRPSPLAANLVWQRTNQLVYEDDTPLSGRPTGLRGDLIREVALGAERPEIPPSLAERFRRKVQRLLPGYPPASATELVEWVKERQWIPAGEWTELLEAIDRERTGLATELVAEAGERLVSLTLAAEPAPPGIAARETLELPRGPGRWLRHRAGSPAADSADGDAEALAAFLADWLRFTGPWRLDRLAASLGVAPAAFDDAVERLVAAEGAIAGGLVAGEPGLWVASLATFETLLRWRRAAARPDFEALPVEALPLYLADLQGLTSPRSGVEGVQAALDRLFGLPVPAALWEQEILPARLEPYQTGWLDALGDEQGLRWVGAGRERIVFAVEHDLPLVAGEAAEAEPEAEEIPFVGGVREALAAFPRGLELGEIVERLGVPAGAVSTALWSLVWRGEATNDSIRALRRGILARFEPVAEEEAGAGPRRGGLRRWSPSRAFPGRWRLLRAMAADAPPDPLREESLARDRARLVLDRYGVVFRELLANEAPAFSWGRLARSFRVLELAGEIVAGQFFQGVPGLQFATPEGLRRLRAGLPERALWWLCAADPASLCGIDLAGLKGTLPRRLPTTHMVFRGRELLLVSRRSGRELEVRLAPDDPALAEALLPLRSALVRAFDPARAIEIETINGEPAARSPYLVAFGDFSMTREGPGVRLRRRYAGGG